MNVRRLILLPIALLLCLPAIGQAQPPTYSATPPTPGALYRDGQTGRYLLGGAWLYRADPTDVGMQQRWWASSIAGWSPVTVPNAYNAGDLSSASMAGSVGWYRRDFTLPGGAFGAKVPGRFQRWIVRFESVNYRASVWLNGRLLGTNTGAYLPFEFDLSGLRRGVNRLVVRVDDRRSGADLPPGPSGDWWNFGGLLGEVYLRAVDAVDVSQVQVTPVLPCPTCAATVEEQATVRNLTGVPQQVVLKGRYGSVPVNFGATTIAPRASWTATTSAVISRPQLWSTQDPHLYRATVTLSDPKRERLGGYVTYSGIRSITVTSDGELELNGRQLDLRGVYIQQQNMQTGAALTVPQMATLIGWARALGSTVIRSHYPFPPEMEEMADRDGILIWSEIPVNLVSALYFAQPAWRAQAYAVLQRNILTNENHPSILLWSIAGEPPTPATGSEAIYIAAAAALAHRLDPTRPVGMGISGWPGVPCQAAYAPLNVIGYDDYFGWFDAGGGTTDDRDALGPYLDSLRTCYPSQALMVSEFGFDANRDGPIEERGTYEFQSNTAAYHLGVFASKPWLAGAIYYTLQDYASSPGKNGGNPWADPPFVQKGLVDLNGNLKPAFAVVSSLYHATTQIVPQRRSAKDHGKQRARPRSRRPET